MSEVSLTIGGKSYRVACADGQEQQLSHLATMVDKKFTQMQNNLASSEAQNLLFAAILLADELNEITTALDRPVHEKENDLSVLEGKLDEAQQLQSILKEENNRLSSENENFKAYAPEDKERFFRFNKLGYKVGRINDYVYHLEHARGENSWFSNPHMQSNMSEWDKIQSMSKNNLLQYYSEQEYLKKYAGI